MARLPQPGSDGGIWGDVLNDFLTVSHSIDGTLKSGSVSNDSIADNTLTSSKLVNNTITTNKLGNGAVTSIKIDSALVDPAAGVAGLRTLGNGANQAMPGNATVTASAHAASHKGGGSDVIDNASTVLAGLMSNTDKIRLDGIATGATANSTDAFLRDRTNHTGTQAGTTVSNTPAGNISAITVQAAIDELDAEKQPIDSDLTALAAIAPSNDDVIQRKSGAWTNRTPAQLKLDLSLTSSDVGLGNVNNTSDATKNSAVAALTNKDLSSGTNTFPTLNQNTTGSAASLTSTRTLWGQNFNGSANVTGDITLSTASITMTGSIATTGARVTKVWATDIESTNVPTVGGVALPTASSTTTLTNKRITARVTTITSSATPTVNTDDCDAVTITALAAAITSMTTNLSGAPTNFQKLIIRIKDDGTARAITWGASFEAKGVALPTTTVISKVLTVGFIYDSVSLKWGCVASVQEA